MKVCDNCKSEIKKIPFYEWNACIFCCCPCVSHYALKLVFNYTKARYDL